jgi:hypothetical protein
MTLELLTALVRCRHEHLLREAANRRVLRATRRVRPSVRVALARVVRATGYVVLSLGDALAGTP